MRPSSKGKKGFVYSLVTLLVISVFILGYLFYFVPLNKQAIHKNGFTILKTIGRNIGAKADAHKTLFENFHKSPDSISGSGRAHSPEEIAAKITRRIEENDRNLSAEAKTKATVKLVDIRNKERAWDSLAAADVVLENGNLVSYFPAISGVMIAVAEPLSQFLQQILSAQKNELFDSYLIGRIQNGRVGLLYDENRNIRRGELIDTLFPRGGGAYLTGIHDLRSQDAAQKMFYYPFELGGNQLVLCGFVKEESYQSGLRNVPFSFVYPLVIIFLLLLVSLPIIKFKVMNSNQQVRIRDVALFGLSVFGSAGLLTLIIIHYLIWKAEESRVQDNLQQLSEQIEAGFKEEIVRIYGEIAFLDSVDKMDALMKNKGRHPDLSDTLRRYIQAHKQHGGYYHFDRISWLDSTGEQRFKAELNGTPVFTRVDQRGYFQAFQNGTTEPLPGKPEERYSWEPIYSITNADFNITVARQCGTHITVMATKMRSLVHTIVPMGYGFCIIDGKGQVLVHSDGKRSQQENLFEKIVPAATVMSATATRQARTVNDVIAYGKRMMVYVQPMDQQPLHLVTFYDKGYIVPVNMRILLFSLLFCFINCITCVALWLVFARSGLNDYPLVYCPLDCLNWLMPRSVELGYYRHACFYLMFYTTLLLALVFHTYYYQTNNLNVLSLLLFTPLNVVGTLYIIRAAFARPLGRLNWGSLKRKRADMILFAGVHLLVSLLYYFLPDKETYQLDVLLLVCQLLFNAVMWVYALLPKTSPLFRATEGNSSLFWYSFLATGLVICLAALPGALYTWYAHNQELTQSVKRQQLYLANSVSERSRQLLSMNNRNRFLPIPSYYLDSMQFNKGIYTLYSDQVRPVPLAQMDSSGKGSFEKLYFDFAEKYGNSYYNEQSYAALKDVADDDDWFWKINDSHIKLSYFHALPPAYQSGFLEIRSQMPVRFKYLSWKHPGRMVLLVGIIALLIAGLFHWIKRNAQQLFLLKYIHDGKPARSGPTLVEEYYSGEPDKEDAPLYSPTGFKKYTLPVRPEHLHQYETEILGLAQKGQDLYAYIWEACTEKEKYLLNDFAQDGLINHKNTKEIFDLLRKGVLVVRNDRIRMLSPGFRAFVISQSNNREMEGVYQKFKENSNWQAFKIPAIIFLIGIATIVFFTQQVIFDRLLILAGGVSTLLTIFMRFFGGSSDAKSAEKKT